jgi:tetratricopeptide (TPR) repeat protein
MQLFVFKHLLKKTAVLFSISISVLAASDDIQLPLYGGIDRNKHPELMEQDNRFIAKAISTFGTREHASEGYVESGFDLFSDNKFDKSMKRFNQAWLLNEDNPYVYLGFGLLLNKKEQSCEASKMFKQANDKGLKESGFLADYAHTTTICALTKEKNSQTELFNTSNKLHHQAIETPNEALRAYVFHSWAKSYFLQGDFSKSKVMIKQSKKLGGKIDAALEQSIKEKSKATN